MNITVIELTKSDLVVLHKNKYIAASQLPFDSISPAIKEQLRFEKARNMARDKGEAIMAQLKSGEPVATLFDDTSWHDTKSYSRTSSEVSNQVLRQAFSVVKPSSDNAQFTGFTASNGNYIVVKVTAVHDGVPADATQEDRDGLQSYLARSNGASELQAFIASLKADADIEVSIENL